MLNHADQKLGRKLSRSLASIDEPLPAKKTPVSPVTEAVRIAITSTKLEEAQYEPLIVSYRREIFTRRATAHGEIKDLFDPEVHQATLLESMFLASLKQSA